MQMREQKRPQAPWLRPCTLTPQNIQRYSSKCTVAWPLDAGASKVFVSGNEQNKRMQNAIEEKIIQTNNKLKTEESALNMSQLNASTTSYSMSKVGSGTMDTH